MTQENVTCLSSKPEMNTPHEGNIDKWQQQRIVARIWRCGHPECNCARPEILEVSPDRLKGYPWILEREIWVGQLIVKPNNQNLEELKGQLKTACDRFGLAMPSTE